MKNKIMCVLFVMLLILLNIPYVMGSNSSKTFDNDPPIANANGPYYGNEHENINFDSSGSYDPEGGDITYLWEFGDGNTSTEANPIYAYSEYGNFTVILTVKDDLAQEGTDITTAYINALPVAVTDGPYSSNYGEEITFNASASYDPDGTIVLYGWDFGDAVQESGIIVTHTYYHPGSYDVVLTVVDNKGAFSNDTTVAHVNSPPTEPSIDGPRYGKPQTEYEYSFITYDIEGDDISFYIEWGDGNITDWTSFVPAGGPYSEKHSWSSKGNYTISAKAKDIYGAESDWSVITIKIPRDRAKNTPFHMLQKFLKNHPNLFLIIRQLLSL